MCSLEKRGSVFILTLTGDSEHRLSPTLLAAIRAALSRIKSESAASGNRGLALVTAADGRFFSNGFDLQWARSAAPGSDPATRLNSMVSLLRLLVADLLSLPMPTIAAVTGHAAAAGLVLAVSHDYVEMRADRGVLYMSEIDLGMPFPPYFLSVIRSKIGDPRVVREILMEGRKIGGREAAEKRIADGAHGGARETLEAAVRRAEELTARNWIGEVYCSIRKGVFPEIRVAAGLPEETDEERKRMLLASKI